MIRIIKIMMGVAIVGAGACSLSGPNPAPPYQPFAGQGQYVLPQTLNPVPVPRIPAVDVCRSQLYLGLVGRHEGSIYIAGLPSPKRIIKPAFVEGFEYNFDDVLAEEPPMLEVKDYLADQALYAPSIRTVDDLIQLGPAQDDRLTIELDQDGYVQEIRCG